MITSVIRREGFLPRISVEKDDSLAYGHLIPRGDALVFWAHDIYVPPGVRRHGTGKQLLRALIDEAIIQGAEQYVTAATTDDGRAFNVALFGRYENQEADGRLEMSISIAQQAVNAAINSSGAAVDRR